MRENGRRALPCPASPCLLGGVIFVRKSRVLLCSDSRANVLSRGFVVFYFSFFIGGEGLAWWVVFPLFTGMVLLLFCSQVV